MIYLSRCINMRSPALIFCKKRIVYQNNVSYKDKMYKCRSFGILRDVLCGVRRAAQLAEPTLERRAPTRENGVPGGTARCYKILDWCLGLRLGQDTAQYSIGLYWRIHKAAIPQFHHSTIPPSSTSSTSQLSIQFNLCVIVYFNISSSCFLHNRGFMFYCLFVDYSE